MNINSKNNRLKELSLIINEHIKHQDSIESAMIWLEASQEQIKLIDKNLEI